MKILYVTTISLTMNSFFKPHIEMLVKEGHQVDIACNYKDLELDNLYDDLGCKVYQVDFSRTPLSTDNIKAYVQFKKLIKQSNYDIVHCHTPNASVITRLACRKYRKKIGLKVFYTAHGFHFYKGAPILNWLVFYPIEKLCSCFTDKLVTINKEDYTLAKNKFKAREIQYIPGVGINLSKFKNVQVDRAAKRREIGVPEDAFLLISVGELSVRKNHKMVLDSLAYINNERFHYIIVGKGALLQELQDYVCERGIASRVHFLGYRQDIVELYKVSDVCCFPSIHEGLPVALMEAMASGIPVVCSNIRGNEDLIDKDSGFLIDLNNTEEFANALTKINTDSDLRINIINANLKKIVGFSESFILEQLKHLYY